MAETTGTVGRDAARHSGDAQTALGSGASVAFYRDCDPSSALLLSPLIVALVEAARYYTGYPRRPVQSKVVEFTTERNFVELLHEGHPVAVAFTFRCAHTKYFDHMLAKASEELYPHVRFVRVDCPSHLGFCIARQRHDFPFVEIFQSSPQVEAQEKAKAPGPEGVTRYAVTVTPFNYDVSPYGFREFFRKHGGLFGATAPAAEKQS